MNTYHENLAIRQVKGAPTGERGACEWGIRAEDPVTGTGPLFLPQNPFKRFSVIASFFLDAKFPSQREKF